MRKIDKTVILSTKYKEWVDELEVKGEGHGKYNSSNNPHYQDVVMNLLHCQNGLCAYTEILLCGREAINSSNWVEGRYTNNYKPKGNLDHFNPQRKESKAWLWENFFMIDTDVNVKKRNKDVDDILKPDSPSYDPFEFLEYDLSSHIFRPHTKFQGTETWERIANMITTLGLNLDGIRDIRRRFLQEEVERHAQGFGIKKLEEIYQFPTAFQMIFSEMV